MIIKNGLVIDPASGLSEKMDLLIDYKRRRGSP